MRQKTHAIQRFWRHVEKTDGCWIWTATTNQKGYGLFAYRPRTSIGAHRFAYLHLVGPIEQGLMVCHTCDNRRCVRPEHLFTGTNTDNMRDAMRKGRLDLSGLSLGLSARWARQQSNNAA